MEIRSEMTIRVLTGPCEIAADRHIKPVGHFIYFEFREN